MSSLPSSSTQKSPPEWLLEASDSSHTCRICYEEFNDGCKIARMLACGHSFCTLCIQRMVHYGQNVYPTCPECRKVTCKPVMSLPINFQFMQMLRKMNLTVERPDIEEAFSTTATVGCENEGDTDEQGNNRGANDQQRLSHSMREAMIGMSEVLTRMRQLIRDEIAQNLMQNNSMLDHYHLQGNADRINDMFDMLQDISHSYEFEHLPLEDVDEEDAMDDTNDIEDDEEEDDDFESIPSEGMDDSNESESWQDFDNHIFRPHEAHIELSEMAMTGSQHSTTPQPPVMHIQAPPASEVPLAPIHHVVTPPFHINIVGQSPWTGDPRMQQMRRMPTGFYQNEPIEYGPIPVLYPMPPPQPQAYFAAPPMMVQAVPVQQQQPVPIQLRCTCPMHINQPSSPQHNIGLRCPCQRCPAPPHPNQVPQPPAPFQAQAQLAAMNNSNYQDQRSNNIGAPFVRTVSNEGQSVLFCPVCNCNLPYTAQASHLSGRRHNYNMDRRGLDEPPVDVNIWRQRHRRRNYNN